MATPDLPNSIKDRFQIKKTSQFNRRLIVGGVGAIVALAILLFTWNEFFAYVPPGKHLVIVANGGKPLPKDHVLAEPGEQGIQAQVQGEGWHFVMPILYDRHIEENTIIPPGKVGILIARGGKPLRPGQVLADPGQRGILRAVLPPGAYRINRHGFDVEQADAVEIKPGFVGVQSRLLGVDGKGRFADGDNEKGILREVLQPGLYYINPKEYQVSPADIGIFQTSFHYDENPRLTTAITFTSKGGFQISMDCTVEWEVLPADMPALIAEYGDRTKVENKVIQVQAHAIGRDKGIDYGVQDFLEGNKREKFQQDFTSELVRVCRMKNVTVHSAFIRNIVIPENYLKPIRDKQIASETELTNKAKEATAQSEADVERETQLVVQRTAEVAAQTERIVATIDRDVENTKTLTQSEIEKIAAEYQAKIAALDAQRVRLLGEAEADAEKLKQTAESGLYRMKLDVFQNNGDAFLRYSMAQDLNEKMILRLFHAGPGTFWTNLDKKDMTLMLPAGGQSAPQPAAPGKLTEAQSNR